MVVYSFKEITVVPEAKQLIDIVLSATQRRTPTEIHPNYKIERIREFYMRKVKFTQVGFHERLSRILDEFPKMDDIHPFYADLMNVLYDRSHYKLALGQIRQARTLIDAVAKDYVKQLKYGDSLDRCKRLKRAAMGRMCTIAKKLGASTAYLEQVRQHLSRLPSIDPSERTLILTGMPSVGKSSLMNAMTDANVEVQPYPFTTKSLFVGTTHYHLMRWQVIDTPGLLDHPLDERNTIEMQAITALAHLRAAIIFILDPSAYCGHTVAAQVALFRSLRPLFAGKPLVIMLNKTDLWHDEDIALEDRQAIDALTLLPDGRPDPNVVILRGCTATAAGVNEVKAAACDRLQAQRVDAKMGSQRAEAMLGRLHVAMPGASTAEPMRASAGASFPMAAGPVIPQGVLEERARREANRAAMVAADTGKGVSITDDPDRWAGVPQPRTLLDEQRENGGAGVYSFDRRLHHMLDDPEWRFDTVPEIWEDLNVADFIDPEIDAKLERLEAEEAAMLAEFQRRYDPSVIERFHEIMALKAHPRGIRSFEPGLRSAPEVRKQSMYLARNGISEATEDELIERLGLDKHAERRRRLEESQDWLRRRAGTDSDFATATEIQKAAMRKRGSLSKKGEADHHIPTLRPKHLYSGKVRVNGKRDRI